MASYEYHEGQNYETEPAEYNYETEYVEYISEDYYRKFLENLGFSRTKRSKLNKPYKNCLQTVEQKNQCGEGIAITSYSHKNIQFFRRNLFLFSSNIYFSYKFEKIVTTMPEKNFENSKLKQEMKTRNQDIFRILQFITEILQFYKINF